MHLITVGPCRRFIRLFVCLFAKLSHVNSCMVMWSAEAVERGISVVECRTRNQVSPGSNPSLLPFRKLSFSFSPLTHLFTQLYKRYLAIDSRGNVSDLALARNCCLARMLPGEAELVSE